RARRRTAASGPSAGTCASGIAAGRIWKGTPALASSSARRGEAEARRRGCFKDGSIVLLDVRFPTDRLLPRGWQRSSQRTAAHRRRTPDLQRDRQGADLHPRGERAAAAHHGQGGRAAAARELVLAAGGRGGGRAALRGRRRA